MISTRKIAVLASTFLLGIMGRACADQPATNRNEDLLKSLRRDAVRANGVLLQATITIEEVSGHPHYGEEVIRIKWTLDYDGPRQPLVILEPSVDRMTGGQTSAEFFLITTGNDLKRFRVSAPHGPGLPAVNREWMLTVKNGETGSGTISIPLGRIRTAFDQQCVGKFEDQKSLHLRLCHQPTERLMDGWTGKVYSKIMPITLKMTTNSKKK